MANDVINVSAFASELGSILSMYSNNVTEATEKWLQDTADKTVKRVRENAKSAGFKANPRYVKGWQKKKLNGKWVVYQKNQPGMAHLLENGHDIIRSGMKIGEAGAFQHIKPAEEAIEKDLKELEAELSKVGVK